MNPKQLHFIPQRNLLLLGVALVIVGSFLPWEGDESYEIEVKKLPLKQIETAMLSGQLDDSNVISAFYLAHLFLEREN